LSGVACENLTTLSDSSVTILSATPVAATEDVPAHCDVRGRIPSQIHFVVQLPLSPAWNGRFLMLGDGGHDGDLDFAPDRIAQGYVTANSDLGHSGSMIDASFAFNNRQAEIDYGYRAVHETTVVAKGIVATHYGRLPLFSYFEGCSTGGRQALMEAQRFPSDFDGIVGGDPAFNLVGLSMEQNWSMRQLFADDFANNIVGKNQLLAEAVMEDCDALDGLEDGLISNPMGCSFDPARLLCGETQDPTTCLTAGQVEAIQRIYPGPSNKDGPIYPGKVFGSEAAWSDWIIPSEANNHFPDQGGFAFDFMNYLFFETDPGPDYSWMDFDFELDPRKGDFMAGILNATDIDLSAFRDQGGKLLLYHSLADGLISPFHTIEYYESVTTQTTYAPESGDFVRLFLAPGRDHCGDSGVGLMPDDWLAPLVDWVESGAVPDQIPATQRENGAILRTRPLCPYPQIPVYTAEEGVDPNEGAYFVCLTL